jgi:hypothetical protein
LYGHPAFHMISWPDTRKALCRSFFDRKNRSERLDGNVPALAFRSVSEIVPNHLERRGVSRSSAQHERRYLAVFRERASQTGILTIDPKTFAVASGLAIADWETINYTGIGPTTGLGTPILSRVFAWADPMPNFGIEFYQPGSSLSDAYQMFLNSLLVAPADSATVADARGKAVQFQMADDSGNSWPGYGITPGLNDFLLSSLQSISGGKPPQIDYSMTAPPSIDRVAVAPIRLADYAEPREQQVDPRPPFFGLDSQPMVAAHQEAGQTLAISEAFDSAASGTPTPKIRFQAQPRRYS